MTRTMFLALPALFLAGLAVTPVSTQTAADAGSSAPVVATAAGRLRGVTLTERKVHLFKGVHYGESTAAPAASSRRGRSRSGRASRTRRGSAMSARRAADVGRRSNEGTALLPHERRLPGAERLDTRRRRAAPAR